MITTTVLRQIAAKGGSIHRINYPGDGKAVRPYSLHYATKGQADASFNVIARNWPTVAATATRDTVLASGMDLTNHLI